MTSSPREDGEFLIRNEGADLGSDPGGGNGRLPACCHPRGRLIERRGPLEQLMDRFQGGIDLLFRGKAAGDNLAAHFGRELADYTVYVIDVFRRRQDPPQRAGPGITQKRFAGDQQKPISAPPGGRRSGGSCAATP